MAKVFLGLGSNLGDRRETLEQALTGIFLVAKKKKISSLYETPALLPEGAPAEWNRPYRNIVVEVETRGGETPASFHERMQIIERAFGRVTSPRWSPRTIDIDILHWEGVTSDDASLILPHPRILEREFVLDPLSEIAPDLLIDGRSIEKTAKTHPKHQPLLMGILNLTPDSFSDGGKLANEEVLENTLVSWQAGSVAMLDLGAESTRPGSTPISEEHEWLRLKPALDLIQKRYAGKHLKPKISIDTRHAGTAAKSLEFGVDIINDVSGLTDAKMLPILRNSDCDYVLMHSLSVPPVPGNTLPKDLDPIAEVKEWFEEKLSVLTEGGISLSRIILDPGIGFGKTSLQSLQLLRGIDQFQSLGCRVLCGHSRKSFIRDWTSLPNAADRDLETLGISLAMAQKGVDILRVHDPLSHQRALQAWRHVV